MNITAVTTGPKQHFFGYYDKSPWNRSGRYILSHEVDFSGRSPTGSDTAAIGLIDTSNIGNFEPLTDTRAWNWQQGSMLQWNPTDSENIIFYNDRIENQFIALALDIRSGKKQHYPLAFEAVSKDGKKALSLNFSRLADLRPGYGYAGIKDDFSECMASEKDGIRILDLQTGKHKMIISLAQIMEFEFSENMKNSKHWFNHVQFSPNSKRFIFLHRWCKKNQAHSTRLLTANIDGTEIRCLNDHSMTSHFDWKDDEYILAYARRFNTGDAYYLFKDQHYAVPELVGKQKFSSLNDGHCSYSPDRNWILTDTYPDEDRQKTLLIYNPEKDIRINLGKYYEAPYESEEFRCDLHPRWSRDGNSICFDSVQTGSRQLYVLDINEKLNSVQHP